MINLDDRLLSKLTPNELFLLLQIVKRMRVNKMVSWPSIERLQKECSWDERTVKKWRASLIEKGYIHMELRPGKPTLYWLRGTGIGVYHPADTESAIEEESKEGTKNEGIQNLQKKRVQKMRGKGVQKMTPELINNELVSNGKGISDSDTPENPETLEAEKKENNFIPRGAVEPDFEATAISSPTQIPGVTLVEAAPIQPRKNGRIEIPDEAAAEIMPWANGDGAQTVKGWYSRAFRAWSPSDVENMVFKFSTVFLSSEKAATRNMMETDPLAFFKKRFSGFIVDQPAFDRMNAPKEGGPTRNGSQPAQNLTSKMRQL